MTYKEGDTFWYHKCPVTNKTTFLPVGMKCPDCVLESMSTTEKARVQQQRYLNEVEGND